MAKVFKSAAYPSKSSLTEGRLMLQEVAHDNNFNSSETDHASLPLGIFASKSVSANTEENSIQSYPSPEFLNSLLFIKKFYPVLNLLCAHRVPQL